MRLVLLVSSLILFLTACGSPSAAPAETIQTETTSTLELTVNVNNNVAVDSRAVTQAPFVQADVRLDAPLLASRNGVVSRVNTDDLTTLVEQGYTIENDQTVKAFGKGFKQQHLNLIQATNIWKLSKGAGVTVAVIDSGVNTNEASLQGALLAGYDFINNSPVVTDESGHGTAVATLIAGQGPFYGIAPDAKILPLRVLDHNNEGSLYHVSRAILYAANLLEDMPNPTPANVINLSLGYYSYSSALDDVIQQVTDAGVTVVAAAGNNGSNSVAFPAALEDVIAVGAAEVNKGVWQRSNYSNYGQGLTVLAPLGGLTDTNKGTYAESGVLSAFNNQQDGDYYQGTSFAAPQVSALAALMLSLNPDVNVERIISGTSSNLEANGWNDESGYGLLNPLASLRALTSTTNSGNIAVQILDAGSLQEDKFFHGTTKQNLTLTPGYYHLKVWYDNNNDGIWQSNEPSYQTSQQLEFGRGDVMSLSIDL